MPDYIDEAGIFEAQIEDPDQAREAVLRYVKERQDREAKFIERTHSRSMKDHIAAQWLAPVRHRKCALMFGTSLDSQIEAFTAYSGIAHFCLPEDETVRPHWSSWNVLSICTDDGSPEECFAHFAEGPLNCVLDKEHDKATFCK